MGWKVKELKGKCCGTCSLFERKLANSSKYNALIPNAQASCNCPVEFSYEFPNSVQKVSMLCEDGKDCEAWQDFGKEVNVIDADSHSPE